MQKAPIQPYNMQIIEFPTGEVQIRTYSKTFGEHKPEKKPSRKQPKKQPTAYLEGFGECTVYTQEEIDQLAQWLREIYNPGKNIGYVLKTKQ